MNQDDAVGLIIALVLANWAAIGAALKCRDKIDGAGNLIWGIASSSPPQSKDMIDFIYKDDIQSISKALVAVLVGVGVLIIGAFIYMLLSEEDFPWIIVLLYGCTGLGMIIGGFITLREARRNGPTIKQIALIRLERDSNSNGD